MNTELEPPPSDFARLGGIVSSKLDDTAAILEKQLQREVDHRKEERFFWIAFCTILLDGILFQQLPAAAIIALFLLELVLLIGVARWLGVDWVVVQLERLLNRYSKPPTKNTEKD